MIEIKKDSFSKLFLIYFDKRMLRILLLGAISGFPWVIIGSAFVKRISNSNEKEVVNQIGKFCEEMRKAADQ